MLFMRCHGCASAARTWVLAGCNPCDHSRQLRLVIARWQITGYREVDAWPAVLQHICRHLADDLAVMPVRTSHFPSYMFTASCSVQVAREPSAPACL